MPALSFVPVRDAFHPVTVIVDKILGQASRITTVSERGPSTCLNFLQV